MIDFTQEPSKLMEILKDFKIDAEKIQTNVEQYNVETHAIIADKAKFPDKTIETENGPTIVPVNRIAFAIQKTIVDKSVAFAFATPVTYIFTDEKKAELIKKILKQNKTNSLTRSVARELYSTSHTAEIWYVVADPLAILPEDKNRLRVLQLKASKGDVFYPVYDNGDMVAFVREINKKDAEGKKQDYAEIYTAEQKMTFINNGGWILSAEFPPEKNLIGKIPVVYGSQPDAEWSDVQSLIDRMENLVSGHAEVNDYHFAPKLKVQGSITGFAKKGEKGSIFEMGKDSNMDYLTWNQGTASLELEFKNLWDVTFKLTQTPDISFESMRGIGAVSGVAWKYLFMDAHLKVEMKREIWDDYLTRRINLIKEFIGKVIDVKQLKSMQEIDVEIQINPYIINDISGKIHDLHLATGKQVVSVRQAVKILDLTDDVEKELSEIEGENKADPKNPAEVPKV